MSGGGVRVGGFTLVELMIVIAIVGTLASIGLPTFNEYARKARMAEVHANLNGMVTAAKAYYALTSAEQGLTGSELSHCRATCRGGGLGAAKAAVDLSDQDNCQELGVSFDAPVHSYYYMGPLLLGNNNACGIVAEGASIQQIGAMYDFDGDGKVGLDARGLIVRNGEPMMVRTFNTNGDEPIDLAAAIAAAFGALNF